MKYWEIIADNLSKAGWSWGCVATINSNGRTIWIVDAHRVDGKRFVVHAEEKLAFPLESRFAEKKALTCRAVVTLSIMLVALFSLLIRLRHIANVAGFEAGPAQAPNHR
jgi:hypothetical protein